MASFFGLDIGSAQIKVVQAESAGPHYRLLHLAAESGDPGQEAATVRAAVKAAGIKAAGEVNLALPESEVYTRIVDIPKLSESELNSAIQFEAEQYIPVSLDQVELFHQILTPDPGPEVKTMKVLLIALTKARLKKLTAMTDQAGLIPRTLETELFALKRILAEPERFQLLLLLSHKTTDMMVVYKDQPVLLRSLPGGGIELTKRLVAELNLSEIQAEQYKRTYGLRPDLLEGKVAAVLTPSINGLVEEINKAYLYLTELGFHKPPEQVVLAGGGALLPGLSAYLVSKLNTEVVVADPFKKFIRDDRFRRLVTVDSNPQWAVAVGLAIKRV